MLIRILFIFLLAAINSGVYLLLAKWRIIEWYGLHRRAWMPNCTFCLFFWLAFIELFRFVFYDVFVPMDLKYTVFTYLKMLSYMFFCSLGAAAISRKLL